MNVTNCKKKLGIGLCITLTGLSFAVLSLAVLTPDDESDAVTIGGISGLVGVALASLGFFAAHRQNTEENKPILQTSPAPTPV